MSARGERKIGWLAPLLITACFEAGTEREALSGGPPGRPLLDAGAAPSPDSSYPVVPGREEPATPPQHHCLVERMAPSRPEALRSMEYQRKTGDCPGSACTDYFGFEASCELRLQVANAPLTATADPADCQALKHWATSDVLLGALSSAKCGVGKGEESTEVYLVDSSPRKKSSGCDEEPFISHRACIAAVRAKYFPGR